MQMRRSGGAHEGSRISVMGNPPEWRCLKANELLAQKSNKPLSPPVVPALPVSQGTNQPKKRAWGDYSASSDDVFSGYNLSDNDSSFSSCVAPRLRSDMNWKRLERMQQKWCETSQFVTG